MLPILILFFGLLDIRRVPVEDAIVKEFTVTQITDDTATDCSDSPSGGAMPLDPFPLTDLLELPVPENTGILPEFSALSTPNDTSISVTQRVVPVTPPNPNPDPEPKPIVVTPEPPPLAVLTISCFALIYLLFGRNPGRRFFRRV